jgi:uroporphyrinogen-III synthase
LSRHTPKKILYLGLNPEHFHREGAEIIHYPVIRIVPRPLSSPDLQCALRECAHYTHVLFTSQSAALLLLDKMDMNGKVLIVIGRATAAYLTQRGLSQLLIAQKETQEGVISLLQELDLRRAYLFWPRSSTARPALAHFLTEQRVNHRICDLYDTLPQRPGPPPDLQEIDEVIFTSPSTVDAFFAIYHTLPSGIIMTPIGPITAAHLSQKRHFASPTKHF